MNTARISEFLLLCAGIRIKPSDLMYMYVAVGTNFYWYIAAFLIFCLSAAAAAATVKKIENIQILGKHNQNRGFRVV